MWTSIVSALAALFGFLSRFMGWWSHNQAFEAGKAAEKVETLQSEKEAASEANKAREEVRAEWAASSDVERMSDDGFSRD